MAKYVASVSCFPHVMLKLKTCFLLNYPFAFNPLIHHQKRV